MQVHTHIERLPSFNQAVVTIGTFDGVHLGHQKIIAQLRQEAARTGGETVIVTFHPHPRNIVRGGHGQVKLLTTIEERVELLAARGIDHLVVVPFTKEFAEQPPAAYIEEFLIARFNPSIVIIGYDHRFGRNREGNYELLEDFGRRGCFELKEIPQHVIKDSSVSSTNIRAALHQGDVHRANELLGYPFFFQGVVVKGDQRGRTIGFPTANLKPVSEEKIVPANGVYVIELEFADGGGNVERYRGMMNIGVRPTVDGTTRTIEVNIFDFNADIYGRSVKVHVHKFLRGEQKFGSIDSLKEQLERDRQQSIHHFQN